MTAAELRAAGARLLPELRDFAPSPLERWQLPAGWPLADVWVKRDDLLGEAGTKHRKLAVELARAKSNEVELVTVGYLDSNHAPATARLARPLGVPVQLHLLGKEAQDPQRAAWLRALAPTRFHSTAAGLAMGVGLRLVRGAGRVRLLPPGGTTPLSTAAVALAVAEVVEQFGAEPLPGRWAVAVGSGGTLAGLWAGIRALGLRVQPLGAATSSRWVGSGRIARLANRALALLGCPDRVDRAEIEIDWQALGGGHGVATPESSEALTALAAEGHILEPIFTAKAMAMLKRRTTPGERWLFWHTGQAACETTPSLRADRPADGN